MYPEFRSSKLLILGTYYSARSFSTAASIDPSLLVTKPEPDSLSFDYFVPIFVFYNIEIK